MNKFAKVLTLSVLLMNFYSCSSAQYASNASYMNREDGKDRETLKSSLFNKNENKLSEEDISRILGSKISIPKKIRLGVVKLESKSTYTSDWQWQGPSSLMNNKAFILNEGLKKRFFEKIKESNRVSDIVILPSMMIPNPLSINSLREASVRLQVDMILVLKSENLAGYKYLPFWGRDKANTLSTVEAVLLDIKTGIIPFTSISTDRALLKESDEDLNRFELMKRSSEQAEGKSLSSTAEALKNFLIEIP